MVTPALDGAWRGVVMDPQSFADVLARPVASSPQYVYVRCVDPGRATRLNAGRVYLVLVRFVSPTP
jgi:hypothetical protein